MNRTLSVLIPLFVFMASPIWAAFETTAKAAVVIDLGTNTILIDKQSDVPLPPASMSKLMTLNMLFEALRDGRITMDTEFGVSKKAHEMGGSKMFLAEGSRVAVRDLIPGIIVGSGNDACVVVAEGLAGSEEAFARLMTQRAKDLGMEGSTFANASGWPHPLHRMSARDLAFLGARLITEFPEYYGYFSQDSFTWEGITQRNRNPLLGLGIGADGLKTGHTEEAGYGLVGSASVGKRRIVFVVSGLTSAAERARESEQIVNWSFRQFVEKSLVSKDAVITDVAVWMGEEDQVNLVAANDLTVILPALSQDNYKARAVFKSPIEAPVSVGDPLGELIVERDGMSDVRLPLLAEKEIARGGFGVRMRASAQILMRKVSETIGGFF